MRPEARVEKINVRPNPSCCVCGGEGTVLHERMVDSAFGAPGEWTLKQCIDPACGLAWLDPAPIPDDLGKAYSGYYTHTDSAESGGLASRVIRAAQDGYLQIKFGYRTGVGSMARILLVPLACLHTSGLHALDSMVMYLPRPDNGATLLDVGCGSGLFVERMGRLGWDAQGLDFDPGAVDAAKSRGLNVALGDLREQRYPDGSFDAVCMNHVIEHVYDPLEQLRECHRVLRPGGKLVILTPNIGGWGHHLFGEHWRPLEPARHLALHSLGSLRRAAASAGFSVQRLATTARFVNGYWVQSKQASRGMSGTGTSSRGTVDQLRGFAFLLAERALLHIRREAGDEILLIAVR